MRRANVTIQSEINIGMVGHVDHGKTTLTKALSGVWTDRHSEEIKRGISIRLGYADCTFYKCKKCPDPDCYCTQDKCPKCAGKTKALRKVSFVDSPGHETLMATMLSGAALMDGAVLVIAANEECPQPQTAEHLMALDILGVKNVVVAQNKVDLVSREAAEKSHEDIKKFLAESNIKKAPIIPIAANYGTNIDALIKAIEENIPTPARNLKEKPRMYVARSFDINKPGTEVNTIHGGVIGGSLKQGIFEVGDEIEIFPGVKKKNEYQPLKTKIASLNAGGENVDKVNPGGLVGIGTMLDPNLTKSDSITGNLVGYPGDLPEPRYELTLDINLLNRLVGSKEEVEIKPIAKDEALMLSLGSAITLGVVSDPKTGTVSLKLPVCTEEGDKAAISRRFGARWRLIGYGIVK
ncbi:MAG: translation initiation factor IF-2 subunit gamma [Candidatus Altiarchaeota archaeon]